MITKSDGANQVLAKPRAENSVREYEKDINRLRQIVQQHIITDSRPQALIIIMSWVEKWNNNKMLLATQYRTARDCDILNLMNIKSFTDYVAATNHLWYGATIIELQSAAEAYEINILVWDVIQQHFFTYLCPKPDKKYCIITREANNHYNLLYGTQTDSAFVTAWTLEQLGPTLKCLFNLNDNNRFSNMMYYQVPKGDGV
jgi:site-specific recombinase XerD